ncbi:hypothetical protein HPB51_007262 [Rhipicephalus microplus]|uniref:Kelch-like protein diablo n=1 Tax=Rhipicephalus microplus TaxID=6941 RepID=A0A9J6E106_RHIMP|nr:hypothetical protein HPB51_007262 [Rhipicephalus microplus]
MKDPTVNGDDSQDDMLTASFQATQLFTDDGRQREFTPAAAARAMPGLREQRKTRQFCDVLFRATNGPEVWAHRFVMCAKLEDYIAHAEIKNIIATDASVNKEKAAVGIVSDYLGWSFSLIQIRDHCLKTLKQNLEPENCIQTYHLATTSGYEYLAGEALRYLVRSFDAVGVYFHSLDFEKVLSYPEVQGDHSSLKVLTVIHKTLTRPSMEVGNVAGIDLSQKQWLRPRIPKDILFVFGGWTSGATNSMHTFNSRAQKWRVMGSQYTPPRAYHGAAVIDSRIYIVGGFNGRECYHSVVCFDVPLARWSAKANMEYARCYVSVAVLQASAGNKPQGGNIYAMGGFDGRSRTKTVERYDIKANQWSLVADMVEVRSRCQRRICSRPHLHGILSWSMLRFAGGFTGTTVLDSVESYDPSTNVWTRIITMSSPRSGAKVVAHEDMLYIIGGYNGVTRLSSSITTVELVEKYDIAARGWYTAPQISTNCSASTACVVEDVADPGPCQANYTGLSNSELEAPFTHARVSDVPISSPFPVRASGAGPRVLRALRPTHDSTGCPCLLRSQCLKGDGCPRAPPGLPKPASRRSTPLWALPEMCAAVAEVKDPAANGADENDGMLTASFEAAQLFIDDGRQREFAPGAAARAMPGIAGTTENAPVL